MIIKRVKAFTILEMTIAMLITAIVIAFTYTTFSILKRTYADFHEKNRQTTELLQLDHVLKRDFFKSIAIYKTEAGLRFINPSDTIDYTFQSDIILRKGLRTDTFNIKAVNSLMLFEQLPVHSNADTLENARVDEFSFDGVFQGQNIQYHYEKTYSSKDVMERIE